MRSLSATLKAAQESNSRKPYIKFVLTSGGTTTCDYSFDPNLTTNRLLKIQHAEFPYGTWGSNAPIAYLRNEDHAVPDLRGYYVDIGYGLYTSSNEYIGDGTNETGSSRLWVGQQQYHSEAGQQWTALKFLNMFDILNLIPYKGGTAPDYTYTYEDTTVYDIMEDLIETYTPFTLDALGVDDGIIDTLTPEFTVNAHRGSGLGDWESIGQAFYRLLGITALYARPKELSFELVYPHISDSVDKTFYSDQAHFFYSYTEGHNLVIPNEVSVFGNQSADGTWDTYLKGSASDTAEQSRFMTIEQMEVYADLDNLTDLNAQAAAYMARYKAEGAGGQFLTPFACDVELYDFVQGQDSR